MLLGIIGYGVVGQTITRAFKMQGHSIKWHDKNNNDSLPLSELLSCDCLFICVSTETINSACDLSNVVSNINDLSDLNYEGVIIIKSTVLPGTTEDLIKNYPNLKINFVPEFLHQDKALDDFLHSTETLIVGSISNDDFDLISGIHAPFIKNAIKISPTEAELVKYFSNNFNSLRIVFANAYYDVCELLGADYSKVLAAATTLDNIRHSEYLKCTPTMRGYSGKCLPKDIEAFNTFTKGLKLPLSIFDAIIKDNEYYLKK